VAAFGAALPLARRYADLLAGPGVERGLLGPREVPRLWERHLVNCAGLADIAEAVIAAAPVPVRPVVVDLGSGAGLPGVVLALLRPRWEVVLLEPLLRRSTFLTEVVEALELTSASVVRARAEDYARTVGPAADLVVARAVAPLDRLVRWALPLTRGGGSLLALKGATAAEELQVARAAVRAAGGVDSEVIAVPQSPSRVVRVVNAAASSAPPAPPAPPTPPARSRSSRRPVPDRRGRP
jgi:16S rRNA (guanine527-N7)-methyltransferase